MISIRAFYRNLVREQTRKVRHKESAVNIIYLVSPTKGQTGVFIVVSDVWASVRSFQSRILKEYVCVVTEKLTCKCISSVLFTHLPSRHHFPSPQLVPSAQGKCLVWHTSKPPDMPVHHRVAHVLSASAQCLDSSPKVNWHCRSASYRVPGRSEGSWRGLWGLSSKHSPATEMPTNIKEQ